jgi:hypothetical protein
MNWKEAVGDSKLRFNREEKESYINVYATKQLN